MNSVFRFKILGLILALLLSVCLYSDAEPDLSIDSSIASQNIHNPAGSFLKSAIVPGWGELSLGNKSGYAFMLLEVLLWSGRFYYLEEAKLLERDAFNFALQHSGLENGSYDDALLNLLTRYNSSGFDPGGYGEFILNRAQSLFPDDKEKQNQYLLDNAIFDDSLFWSWESREHRRLYSIKRKNANHNRDYAKAVMGVIVANHLLSAFNSARIAVIENNRAKRLEFSIELKPDSLSPVFMTKYRF